MFGRTRPVGTWINLTDLDGFELEDLDKKTAAAMDGDAGGVYEPTQLLSIGGAGLEVTGPFSVTTSISYFVSGVFNKPGIILEDAGTIIGSGIPGLFVTAGNLVVNNGNGSISGNLEVFQDLIVDGNATVKRTLNGTTVNANTFSCLADVTSGATGSGYFAGPLTVDGFFNANATSNFNNTVVIWGAPGGGSSFINWATHIAHSAIELTGQGHLVKRISISSLSGASVGQSATYGVNDSDIVMIAGNGVLVGNITWRISAVGAETGCQMEVSRALETSDFFVNVVNDADGTSIITLDNSNFASATLVFQGNTWKCLHRFKDHD